MSNFVKRKSKSVESFSKFQKLWDKNNNTQAKMSSPEMWNYSGSSIDNILLKTENDNVEIEFICKFEVRFNKSNNGIIIYFLYFLNFISV